MMVDAGDTGVLLHLFLVNVASLRHEEENLLKRWAFFLKAQYCHLTREYKNAYSILATSPNAEGLTTNHHNTGARFLFCCRGMSDVALPWDTGQLFTVYI